MVFALCSDVRSAPKTLKSSPKDQQLESWVKASEDGCLHAEHVCWAGHDASVVKAALQAYFKRTSCWVWRFTVSQ